MAIFIKNIMEIIYLCKLSFRNLHSANWLCRSLCFVCRLIVDNDNDNDNDNGYNDTDNDDNNHNSY